MTSLTPALLQGWLMMAGLMLSRVCRSLRAAAATRTA